MKKNKVKRRPVTLYLLQFPKTCAKGRLEFCWSFMYIALSGARFPLQLAYKCRVNLASNEFFFIQRVLVLDKRYFSSRKNCIRLQFVFYSETIAKVILSL